DVIRLNHTTDPEVLFIGNSITHFWGGEPVSHCNGGKTWSKLWGKRRVVNMGFGWDMIENVFWRINHGELEGCAPEYIFLLIGINNINNGEKVEDVARGIVDLAAAINSRQPQAKLYVLETYPAKGKEEIVERLNSLVREWLPVDEQVRLVSLNAALTLKDGSGKINPDMFIEGLHPNEKGYAALAKELRKQCGVK
ncbi:MAG: acetylhydrolase, partial [Muribaculaceae bacterium]|nr:acetylhydrolase [Muribaculaceae bacterium]